MRRREFVSLLGSAAAWPVAARAQQSGKVWRIGFLGAGARPTNLEGTAYGAFLRGMRELGYAENQNFIVEWRFAEGRLELLPTLAEELVRSNVDVIVVGLTAAIPVVKRATSTIPIVMAVSVDPVVSANPSESDFLGAPTWAQDETAATYGKNTHIQPQSGISAPPIARQAPSMV